MKKLSLALRLRNMKAGNTFNVTGKHERAQVCRTVKTLRDAESLRCRNIITVQIQDSDIFQVLAL